MYMSRSNAGVVSVDNTGPGFGKSRIDISLAWNENRWPVSLLIYATRALQLGTVTEQGQAMERSLSGALVMVSGALVMEYTH